MRTKKTRHWRVLCMREHYAFGDFFCDFVDGFSVSSCGVSDFFMGMACSFWDGFFSSDGSCFFASFSFGFCCASFILKKKLSLYFG